jgi:hypothetical protein
LWRTGGSPKLRASVHTMKTSLANEPLRFLHKPKLGVMAGVSVFFAVCAVVLWHRASTNQRGLILWHVIDLGAGSATAVYWCLVIMSIAFALTGLAGVAQALGRPQYVVLDDDAIELPPTLRRWSKRRVPYASVHAVELWSVNGLEGLRILHKGGADGIAKAMLDDAAFVEIERELRARCALADAP